MELKIIAEAEKAIGRIVNYEYSHIFGFEKITFGNVKTIADWLYDNLMIPVLLAVFYGIALYFGRQFMSKRKPYEVRIPLVIWNAFLAIFSAFATVRVLPPFLYTIFTHGWHFPICHPFVYDGVTGFWGLIFVLSKPVELVDTLFIVLRKQSLQFLHWYHHMTAMFFAWYSYSLLTAMANVFYVANFIVHTFMYSYYALRAARIRVPKLGAIFITTIQLIQMVIGFSCLIYGINETFVKGNYCRLTWQFAAVGIIIYGSYFGLFSKLFYENYICNQWSKRAQSVQKNEKKSE